MPADDTGLVLTSLAPTSSACVVDWIQEVDFTTTAALLDPVL